MFIRKRIGEFTPSPRFCFNVHLDGMKKSHDLAVEREGVFDEAVEGIKSAKARGFREVESERTMANIHGTFYLLPRETGVKEIQPVATHNRQIMDYCTWRGLLVLAGARKGAKADGHYFGSGETGLWFGQIDEMWKLGKPVGKGGVWKNAAVKAGKASDPYLMTGYDKKSVALSHGAAQAVTFTLEVDVDHSGVWRPYKSIEVPAGETVTHEFPEGYCTHWVRVKADRDCTATAMFTYE
jgi:hypothetical protein